MKTHMKTLKTTVEVIVSYVRTHKTGETLEPRQAIMTFLPIVVEITYFLYINNTYFLLLEGSSLRIGN